MMIELHDKGHSFALSNDIDFNRGLYFLFAKDKM